MWKERGLHKTQKPGSVRNVQPKPGSSTGTFPFDVAFKFFFIRLSGFYKYGNVEKTFVLLHNFGKKLTSIMICGEITRYLNFIFVNNVILEK